MRWIVYVDMDAFYLSCELTRHPELKGEPALVAHDPKGGKGRGVVLSASYEARALGFRSAMPVRQAWAQREKVSWVLPDFPFYEALSSKVMAHLKEHCPLARSFSIDEAAYPLEGENAKGAEAEARALQQEIRARFSLPCSIGVSTSLPVSKIASDKAKPGGVVVVPPEGVATFLAPLPVKMLPGVGPVTEKALKDAGILVVQDINRVPLATLARTVGSMAGYLKALAEGAPREEPWPDELPPRSMGTMMTFDEDVRDEPTILREVTHMGESLVRGLRERSRLYRTVTVRVRWEDMSSTQRSRTVPHHTDSVETLSSASQGIVRSILSSEERAGRGVRTLGLTVGDLRPADTAQRRLD
jgi:DNA polymerase-4